MYMYVYNCELLAFAGRGVVTRVAMAVRSEKPPRPALGLEDEAEFGGPTFNPPLYKQRYMAVVELARSKNARRVRHSLLGIYKLLVLFNVLLRY